MATPGRKVSEGRCSFKGNGKATLTIFGYRNWKTFFKCNDRDLTDEEAFDVEYAADYHNFSVEGVIRVDWPDVIVEFNMDKFVGKTSKKPMILSATQNFSKLIHPFAVNREWFKGYDSRDALKVEGGQYCGRIWYEWAFEQDSFDFSYKGHIRKGGEIFVTFEFGPDKNFHRLEI